MSDELIAEIREKAIALIYEDRLGRILQLDMENHPKTPVSVNGKSADIDNDLVSLITSLWHHDFETTASCQNFGHDKAYVQFLSGAERFVECLQKANINCETDKKEIPVEIGEGIALRYSLVTVLFPTEDIERVSQAAAECFPVE